MIKRKWMDATLILIVLFGGFLRLWGIGVNPPSLSWDEVSIGYNAYSIAKTGRDEHGKFFPLDAFTAYGDYKPPLSIYATVPFVSLLGLTEEAVRLPSALAGTLTVALVYFLASELFRVGALSLLASALLAISPWHIQLSRAGFEANIAVFFVVLGMYLVCRTRTRPRYWLIALLPFVASIYTFNSARYFSPILGVGVLVWLGGNLQKQARWLMGGIVIAAVFLLPIAPHLMSKEARLRFEEVNIFSDSGIVLTANSRIEFDNQALLGKILHNRRIGYLRSYLLHFFDHFDPQFLFVRGDGNPKFSIQDVGQLYSIEFPFLVAGVYFVLSRFRREGLLLLFWLLASMLPAAVARETPHALRIENSLPVWHIFIAGGIMWFFTVLKGAVVRRTFTAVTVVAYVFAFSYYLHNYHVHYPREFSGEWQYGYREAIRFVSPIKENYQRVYLTESIGRPYAYVLFYERTDPSFFLSMKESYFDAAGFYHVSGFGSWKFVGNELPKFEKGSLYVLPPGVKPQGARTLTTIYKLNGEPVLEIFDL